MTDAVFAAVLTQTTQVTIRPVNELARATRYLASASIANIDGLFI
jgi:hypothetical protein